MGEGRRLMPSVRPTAAVAMLRSPGGRQRKCDACGSLCSGRTSISDVAQQPPQPIAEPDSDAFCTSHASDSGSKFGAEQAGISGLKREATHGCQPQVDRRPSKTAGLQVQAIAQNDGLAEGQSRGSE
jgi:hypothetical protein